MTYEEFIDRLPKMDEKDMIDYIEEHSQELVNSEELDTYVVRMILTIGKKINILDSDWVTFYIELISNPERKLARNTIYQLMR